MTGNGYLQVGVYLAILFGLGWPLGWYMARIYHGDIPAAVRWLAPLERAIYRLCGVDPDADMHWLRYTAAALWLNVLGLLAVYLLQRLQHLLPLNPAKLGAISPDSAFNTAISFATNTNWQGYAGEATMSHLTQMLGLGVQNFVSAAVGMAVLVALARAFGRREAAGIGNFWVDFVRSTLYILLPLALSLALALVSQGVVQNFSPPVNATLLEPQSSARPALDAASDPDTKHPAHTTQAIAMGPAASQIAIKQLGTNGGGFFNANSAHPFENPTPLSNFLELVAILMIPVALCFTFGHLVGDRRQGRALFAAMTVIFLPLLALCLTAEQSGNPLFERLGLATEASALQAGGNMEGKETRFGIVNSALWATATTAASNGSVNAMHDAFTPLGGLAPLWLMQLGEVVYGGVGSGLYGLLFFALIGVFVAGLMIGRTPEYLGKKIEAFEMQMAAVAVLVPCITVLAGTALAVSLDAGRVGVANPGAHGFSEILYALSSAGNNNGSAFGGLSANTPFYNTLLGFAMLLARYWLMVPALAIACALAAKKIVPPSAGTLPTHTPLFVGLLVVTVIVVGALSFLPALALGPLVEHLQMIGTE